MGITGHHYPDNDKTTVSTSSTQQLVASGPITMVIYQHASEWQITKNREDLAHLHTHTKKL